MRIRLLLLVLLALAPTASARPLDELGAGGGYAKWTWTTIVPGEIGLGGGELDAAEVHHLAAEGFRAVLSVRKEYEDDQAALAAEGMTYLRIPLEDAEHDTLDAEEIDTAVRWIEEQVDAGRPVYIHCHAGRHRSAAIAAAWLMVREDLTPEEAWARLEAVRPEVEPRWVDGLYAYEAWRRGIPRLDLDLRVSLISPAAGDVVEAVALVTLGGRPYAGAQVAIVPEYRDVELESVSGPDGTLRFSYEAKGWRREYVHAIARAEGFAPGYDRAVLYGDGSRKMPGPATLHVDNVTVVDGRLRLHVETEDEDGDDRNLRVTITDGTRTVWRSYVGRDGEADVSFTFPRGATELVVRASDPYTDTVTTVVQVPVDPSATLAPPPEPSVEAPPTEKPGKPSEDAEATTSGNEALPVVATGTRTLPGASVAATAGVLLAGVALTALGRRCSAGKAPRPPEVIEIR